MLLHKNTTTERQVRLRLKFVTCTSEISRRYKKRGHVDTAYNVDLWEIILGSTKLIG